MARDKIQCIPDDRGVVDEAHVHNLLGLALADRHGSAEMELELRPGVAHDVVDVQRPHIAALVLVAFLEPGPEQDLESVALFVLHHFLDLHPEQSGPFLLEVERQIQQPVSLRERIDQVNNLTLLFRWAGWARRSVSVLRAAAPFRSQRGLLLLSAEEDHENASFDGHHSDEASACAGQASMQEQIEPGSGEDAPAVALRAEELEVAIGAEFSLEHALVGSWAEVER
ncbi:hypothetical protein Mapa_003017 [Marchantia paleacea]|nr:hypothetical protein Mapa_003017 [Marchantia paleacea]